MEQHETKKKNRALIFIIIIIVCALLVIGLIWMLWPRTDVDSTNIASTSLHDLADLGESLAGSGYEPIQRGYNITHSRPTELLFEEVETEMSSYAGQDRVGLKYYGLATDETNALMVYEPFEDITVERWSSEPGESHIEVVGVDLDRVVFIFTEQDEVDCDVLWNTNNVYYGVGIGTDNYSGAAGLLLEHDEELIAQQHQTCMEAAQ